MPRRWTCLRNGAGPYPGDRIKVLGGTVHVGAEGTYQEDGTVKTDDGSLMKVNLHRAIVIKLGAVPVGGKWIKPSPPQPVSHSYRKQTLPLSSHSVSPKKKKSKTQSIGYKISKGEPLPEEDIEFLKEQARIDQKLFDPKPTKMENKGQKRRKKGAEWGFG